MVLRWTTEAAEDLERITDYLFEHTPERAARLVRALYDVSATNLKGPVGFESHPLRQKSTHLLIN